MLTTGLQPSAVAVKTPVFFCKFARMNVLTIRCVDSQTRRLRRVCSQNATLRS